MTPEETRRRKEEALAELCRRHFAVFVRTAWKIVVPDPLVWNWHLDIACEELEEVTRGKTRKLLINVPPGSSKTIIASVLWPAWEWIRSPHFQYLCASYSTEQSLDAALKMRDLVTSKWYQTHFGIRLRPDQETKTLFVNTAAGARLSTSTGGRATGAHPHRRILDDLLNAEDAYSEKERRKAVRWMTQTLSTRGAARENLATVMICQRLHQEDPAGVVLKRGGWKHVCIPMRYEPDQGKKENDYRAPPHPKDPRTEPGELLDPRRFPEEKVQELERDLGSYGTAGQLQQRPAPEGGGMFKRNWFPVVSSDLVPANARRVRAWDVAGTPEDEGAGSARTAGVRMADAGEGAVPRFFVEHVYLGRWDEKQVDDNIKEAARVVDGKSCTIYEEQEPGSAGKAVVRKRQRDLVGYRYVAEPASGKKVVRAGPLASAAQGGLVALVDGGWNEEFLDEVELFPNGETLDQVDAASHAFNYLTTGPRKMQVRKAVWV